MGMDLKEKFPKMLRFVGSWIRKLTFKEKFNDFEKSAWKSFKNFVENFLLRLFFLTQNWFLSWECGDISKMQSVTRSLSWKIAAV